jgi:hypothetical protein
MTRTLILHIGHYKTGTTAVQIFCDRNAAALARRGVTWAAAGRHLSKHSDFAFALLRAGGATTLMHGYRRPDPPQAVWAPLLAEVRAAPTPAVLISSEEFMRLALFPGAVAALHEILAGAPDIRLRVLAWLRPVGPHLRSWHNQMVKMGRCRVGFQTAVCTQFEAIHHDYALSLAPWARLAGPGGLCVRPYDGTLRQGTRMYAEFCAALGIGLPRWPVLPQGDPNPRLDDRLLDLVRLAGVARLPEAERAPLLARGRARLAAGRRAAMAEGPAFARIRDRAADALAEVARLAGPGFPLDAFLAQGPEAPDEAEHARAALLEAVLQDRVEREAAHARASQQAQARITALEAQLAALRAAGPAP